jgi:hypothetical protein
MNDNAPAALQSAATDEVEQRAQWEAFEFSVPESRTVRVENHSHENPEEHTYDVEVRHGSAVSCECPADEYHDGPCKHRIAVEDQPPVLGAATEAVARDVQARTDGGTRSEIIVASDDGVILDEDEDCVTDEEVIDLSEVYGNAEPELEGDSDASNSLPGSWTAVTEGDQRHHVADAFEHSEADLTVTVEHQQRPTQMHDPRTSSMDRGYVTRVRSDVGATLCHDLAAEDIARETAHEFMRTYPDGEFTVPPVADQPYDGPIAWRED